MKNVRETEDLDTLFTLPLSEQAFNELQDLQLELHSVPYDDAQIDSWVFIWGSSIYSSQKFYALSFKKMATSPCFTWLSKSKCIPRIKFFGWLILVDSEYKKHVKTMKFSS